MPTWPGVDEAGRLLAERLRELRRAPAGPASRSLRTAVVATAEVRGVAKGVRGGRGRTQARIAKVEAASSIVRIFQPLIAPAFCRPPRTPAVRLRRAAAGRNGTTRRW
ncbi:MAG: hypothetical protein ACRDYA_10145 [Egibacteraceae bacterium]